MLKWTNGVQGGIGFSFAALFFLFYDKPETILEMTCNEFQPELTSPTNYEARKFPTG
jgi:hypothetical protein